MTTTVTLVPVVDDAGKVKKTTIETYHCSLCGSFAGSGETGQDKPKRKIGYIAEGRAVNRRVRKR